ncbi:MAG: phosphodiester glycosidase family protein [Fimbriimonadaceae bacterium]
MLLASLAKPQSSKGSRKVCLSALLLALSLIGSGQVWLKPIAPGLTYRMEVDLETPRVIHALRLSLDAPTTANTELAGLKVYSEPTGKGRETLGDLIKRTGAIAGINGDFFPFTGDPLGLMVRNGELVSRVLPSRAAFGWGGKHASGSMPNGDLAIRLQQGSYQLDGLNQECGVNELMLNLEAAGDAVAEKGPVSHAIIALSQPAKASPRGGLRGYVVEVKRDLPRLAVGEGLAILTGSGSKAAIVNSLTPGEEVVASIETGGFDWSKVRQVIGGGPFLVRDGKVQVDWERQGFKADFALKRNPRTAVGATADGDLWFVALDGRQAISDGATLEEMARIMISLGCREAINLDGGGSTTINAGGLTLNRPSDGQQRPIANAVLFYGSAPKDAAPLNLNLPESVAAGDTIMLKVFDAEGKPVPTNEVIWTAQGKAWVDQGGALRGIAEGDSWVFAYVRGQVLSGVVSVKEQAPPTPLRR